MLLYGTFYILYGFHLSCHHVRYSILKWIEHERIVYCLIITSGHDFKSKTTAHMNTKIFKHLPILEKRHAIRLRSTEKNSILALRLIAMMLLVAVLTMHVRSLKVFKWEQSVSGGVLVTYLVAIIGLALCAGATNCDCRALQAYLCSTGSAMLLVNAGAIWHRWKYSSQATQALAEILYVLGVPLRRQVILKVSLCSAAALVLLLDLAMVPIMTAIKNEY